MLLTCEISMICFTCLSSPDQPFSFINSLVTCIVCLPGLHLHPPYFILFYFFIYPACLTMSVFFLYLLHTAFTFCTPLPCSFLSDQYDTADISSAFLSLSLPLSCNCVCGNICCWMLGRVYVCVCVCVWWKWYDMGGSRCRHDGMQLQQMAQNCLYTFLVCSYFSFFFFFFFLEKLVAKITVFDSILDASSFISLILFFLISPGSYMWNWSIWLIDVYPDTLD